MAKTRSSRQRSAFGQRMLDARVAAGLTQIQVRAALGVSQGTLSQLEGDAASSGSVVEYARLYRVNPLWLATGDGGMRAGLATMSKRAAYVAAQLDAITDPETRDRAMVLCEKFAELAQAGQLDSAITALQAMAPAQPAVRPTLLQPQHHQPQSADGRAKQA